MAIDESTMRLDVWRDVMVMVKDHPLGVGLAGFGQVYPVYKVKAVSDTLFTHAHNDYLQLLAEAGWPGFLALVGAFGVFLVSRGRRLVRMGPVKRPFRFFIGAGALAGLTSMGFHSFFDFNLQIAANVVYFVLLVVILDGCAVQNEQR